MLALYTVFRTVQSCWHYTMYSGQFSHAFTGGDNVLHLSSQHMREIWQNVDVPGGFDPNAVPDLSGKPVQDVIQSMLRDLGANHHGSQTYFGDIESIDFMGYGDFKDALQGFV